MSLKTGLRKSQSTILATALAAALTGFGGAAVAQDAPTLTKEQFDRANLLYFQQCAGCHGILRKGATGKNLEPENMLKLGQQRLERIIALGTEGGMNNFDMMYSKEDIALLATYLQMDVPVPPERNIAQMRESVNRYVELSDYPTKPLHGRNWQNFFLVIERDHGSVSVVDGDTKELVARIPTGYAVHVLKSTENNKAVPHANPEELGRFWYTMGRDGKMTKIDLWQVPEKMLVADVQIAYDARDVAVSGDGKYVIGGGYWPPHFVILDGKTMEPLKVVSSRGINVDGEYVNESRVAAIYDTPHAPSWVVNMKELGQTWQVDYSDIDNLRIEMIDNAKYLHDGFFDPTGRYFQIASNASNIMSIMDTKTRKLEALIEVDALPHPGPGANWVDPKCGPVGATPHLGVGKMTVWGNDPINHPDHAWKICYEVDTDGPGLFIRQHENSRYVWIDQTIHPDQEVQQSFKIIDKETREVVKTVRLAERTGDVAVHFEFNQDGSEVWVSIWNRGDSLQPNGEMVVFDANTLEEKARVKDLYAPTGKFNVYNRTNHKT